MHNGIPLATALHKMRPAANAEMVGDQVDTQIRNLVDHTLNKNITQSMVPVVLLTPKQELEHQHNSLVLSGYVQKQIL